MKPAELSAHLGQQVALSEWIEITQERINAFADATGDHQFIHVDAEGAAAGPFGAPIAHGFLSLSMLVHLTASIDQELPPLDGVMMGINYGFDKVRFLNPVNSGKRVRAHSVISKVELKGAAINTTRTINVEIEGAEKPALMAEWIGRLVFDS